MTFSKKQKEKKEHRNIGLSAKAPASKCADAKCPWHGAVPLRGRTFVGEVNSAGGVKSAIVRWDHMHYITKYERYERRNTSVAAYNPACIAAKKGDKVRIAECRPISKTKSFVVIEILPKAK